MVVWHGRSVVECPDANISPKADPNPDRHRTKSGVSTLKAGRKFSAPQESRHSLIIPVITSPESD